MKALQIILSLIIISFSFTQNDNCYTTFERLKEENCLAINSQTCRFSSKVNQCFTTTSCSQVDDTECDDAKPPEFNKYKCVPGGDNNKCKQDYKTCEDYKPLQGDTCEDLYAGENQRCMLASSGTKPCISYYNKCENVPSSNLLEKCSINIPSDFKLKCVVDNTQCVEEARECSNEVFKYNETLCPTLTPVNTKKACVFKSGECKEDWIKCENYDGSNQEECENILTYDTQSKTFNNLVKCVYDATKDVKCETKPKLCEDYIKGSNLGEETCLSYQAEDPNQKRCLYDSNEDECYEEFLTCALYNSLADNLKTKENCEKIILKDLSKKCIFNEVNKQCSQVDKVCSDYKVGQTEEFCTSIIFDNLNNHCQFSGTKCIEKYNRCEDYKGTNKKICETIVLPHTTCILRKDQKCEESKLKCSEAGSSEAMCKFAKASSDDKECIFYEGNCFENYKKCEYAGYSECADVKQFDGKACIYDSELEKCKQTYKKCNQAMNETECKMMAKTGVSDPDIKRCIYIGGTTSFCVEKFIYCSELRSGTQNECKSITPYDREIGEYIDISSECELDSTKTYGCERIPLECNTATTSVQCKSISEELNKNNPLKYCAFIGTSCEEHYISCDAYNEEESHTEACTNIKPRNYLTQSCVEETVGGVTKCVEKPKDCDSLVIDNLQSLCTNIDPSCSYDNGICTKTEKSCNQIIFSSISDSNMAYCNSIKLNDENKICNITKNKMACEEVDKNFKELVYVPIPDPIDDDDSPDNTSPSEDNNNNENNSGNSNSKGNYLCSFYMISIALYLLL